MLEVLTGMGLATAAGLNAYIPLLVVGLLDRYTNLIDLPESWDWLASPWMLSGLALLLIIEVVADKVPVVDHINDVIQTVVRPTAGGLTFGAASGAETIRVDNPSDFFTENTWLPILAGAIIAFAIHLAKAGMRPIINATTVGIGAPIVSATEDGASITLSLAAIIIPFLILIFLIGIIVLFGWLWKRRQ